MSTKKGPQKGTRYIATNPHHFGKNLAEIRRKKGFTQTELAKKSGVSKRTITYYERETQNPSLATMTKLANALDVPAERFLPKKETEKATAVDRSLSKRFNQAQQLPLNAKNELKKIIDGMVRAYDVAKNDD
jgi:transcriptional regulator with XRE-family HTH domain